MARDVVIVPHTHWDREWYAPFQTFRLKLVDLVDDLLPLLERRPGLRPLHARRADGRRRRLPGGPARETEAALRRLAAVGAAGDGSVVHPHGRVPRVGRDDGPRPAARAASRRPPSAARWRSATCPTCSATSPRCPSCCSQFGFDARGRVAGRAVGGRRRRVLVGGARRLDGAGRVPARGLRQRRPPARRRQGARAPWSSDFDRDHGRTCSTVPLLWMNGTDHLLPKPWLGRVWPRPTTSRTTTTSGSPRWPSYLAAATDRRPRRVAGRAAIGRPGQPADGRRRRTASTCKQAAAAAERGLERLRRAAQRALPPAPTAGRQRCSTRRGAR